MTRLETIIRGLKGKLEKKSHRSGATYSLQGNEHIMAKNFMAIAVGISFAVCCIENSLPIFFLGWVPVIIFCLRRNDYKKPVYFSENTLGLFLIPYVAFVSLWYISNPDNRYSLPHFFAFFASGVFLIRVMGPLRDRYVYQLFFLSVCLTLVNCILTNHLIFGLALPFYLYFLMAGLLYFNNALTANKMQARPETRARSSKWWRKLAVSTAILLALAFFMFLLFPRPFIVFPGLRSATAGQGSLASLRDRISYKEMVGMGDRRRIAFMARVKTGRLPLDIYWRGRVLEKYEDQGWGALDKKAGFSRPVGMQSARTLKYTIFPYRLHTKYLYVAGLPLWVDNGFGRSLHINTDREVVVDSDFLYSDMYEVRSVLEPIPVARRADPVNLDTSGITPGIRNLAQEWRGNLTSDRAIADTFLTRLKSGFTYELEPEPPPEDAHPLEYFLNRSKTGNCEYFAGAMALLLRSVGIPARMVEGFYGIEPTDTPNEFLVRFSRAHAWVEANLDGKNWTLLDPTPITQYTGPATSAYEWFSDQYDRITLLWVTNIVNYDRSDQRGIVQALKNLVTGRGRFAHGIRSQLKIAGIYGAALFGLVIAVLLLRKALRVRNQGCAAIYQNAMKELKKMGALSETHQWHEINQELILNRAPSLERPLKNFMNNYYEARFSGSSEMDLRDLRQSGKRLVEAARASMEH